MMIKKRGSHRTRIKSLEIEEIKKQKKEIPYKLSYKELPENEKFDKVINQRKHFLDTIKLIGIQSRNSIVKHNKTPHVASG